MRFKQYSVAHTFLHHKSIIEEEKLSPLIEDGSLCKEDILV